MLHKKLDLDGDGEKDDCMHTIEFSLSRPFNPVFPWDPEGTNARFYGGLTGFFMDTQEGRFWEGGGPNVDHGTNDDLNFMSFYFDQTKAKPGSRLGGYAYNYICKDTLDERGTWLKLGPFEVEAVVHRPARASENLAMVEVAKPGTVPAFHVSKTEIPFTLWQKVYRWSVSHMYCHQGGYIMDRDGDMGSMDRGPSEHGSNEPVTAPSIASHGRRQCDFVADHHAQLPLCTA